MGVILWRKVKAKDWAIIWYFDRWFFLISYAIIIEFSAHKSSEYKKDGMMCWKYFVCHKEDYILDKAKDASQSNSTKIRKQCLTIEGCDAYFGFKLSKEGKYELV